MPNHRRQLVRLVANAPVMGQGDPLAGAYRAEPVFVALVGSEMIAVPLDRETRGSQDVGESGAEIAVGEEDTAQAVRS
jgi:hypothetical protein